MAIPEVWSDLHPSIITDAKGAIKKVINVDAVIGSIDNILRTHPGERLMLAEFAAGLQDLVFEPALPENFDDIANRVKREVELWDPRVMVRSIDFKTEPDIHTVTLIMFFAIRGYDQIFEYSTALRGV